MLYLLVVITAVLGIWWWKSRRHPTTTLPNGLVVHSWQPGETSYLYTEIFADRSYAEEGVDYSSARQIVDVGANIGMFAVWASREAPRAKILSLEPVPAVHAVLQANAKLHAGGRITALNVGASSATGNVELKFHPHFSLWSTAERGFDESRAQRLGADLPAILQASPQGRWVPAPLRLCLARLLLRLLNRTSKVRARGGVLPTPLTHFLPQVRCKLCRLSDVFAANGVDSVDILKVSKLAPLASGAIIHSTPSLPPAQVDVEGHELDVLRGIDERDWPKIKRYSGAARARE